MFANGKAHEVTGSLDEFKARFADVWDRFPNGV
jgi:hypothetical protein